MDAQQNENMNIDYGGETQEQTQIESQMVDSDSLEHLWGYLQPCQPMLNRIDFMKLSPKYSIGRAKEVNQVVLPGTKISEFNSRA